MPTAKKLVFVKLEYKRLDSLTKRQRAVIELLNLNVKEKQKIIDLQATRLANEQAKNFLLNEKLKKEVERAKGNDCNILTKGKYFVSGLILGIIIKSVLTHTSGGLPY